MKTFGELPDKTYFIMLFNTQLGSERALHVKRGSVAVRLTDQRDVDVATDAAVLAVAMPPRATLDVWGW